MKNAIAAGLCVLALGLHGQKMSVMFHYGDSLLGNIIYNEYKLIPPL